MTSARDEIEGRAKTRAEALEIARGLANAGVPVFVAVAHTGADCAYEHCRDRADLDAKTEFHHPPGWQHADAGRDSLANIERWRPGDALCAVMGHGVDVVDVDPRNGGDATFAALLSAGLMPRSYGVAMTPSGGCHYLVAGLHAAKGKAGAGVDVQAGADDGTGRGFVYVAPTVRRSKVTGELTAYHWTVRPELGDMEGDDSGEALGALLRAARRTAAATVAGPDVGVPAIIETDDPFAVPDNSLTVEQARGIYLPVYEAFRDMRTPQDTGFNDALNRTAMVVGHFVPAFMTAEQATEALYAAAVHNLSVDYQGASRVRDTIRSGLRAGMREPRARREARAPGDEQGEGGGDGPDAADLLIGEMLSAEQLRTVPGPAPLIQGVLDLDTTSWLIGKSGSFKTFVALDWAGHVGTGKPWQGREVARGTVVCIVAEGARGVKLRVAAWERLHGPMTGVWFLPRPVQAGNATAWDALVEACRRLDARMVVIDTQARVTVGMDENAARDMGLYVDAADRIKRATGACVLTVHHIGRSGTDARGSSALDGAQDAEIRIDREGKERRITLIMDKQKDADDSDEIALELAVSEAEPDPVTGRNLSSLVVVAPGTLPAVAKIRDWVDNLTINQAETVGILEDHFPAGATETNIERVLNERRALLGRAKMAHGSFTRAVGSLQRKGIIGKIKGTQKYILMSMDDAENA